MIVDTSAIMAILLDEEDRETITNALIDNPNHKLAAGSWVELAAVVTRSPDPMLAQALDRIHARYRFEIMPMSVRQAEIGHAAYRKYGRGTNSPARLNLGDCFAYALAKDSGEPLLYKGDDFGHTDIASAL